MSATKELVIVESPGKLKTLSKYLGDGYIVKASVGHVRDLPESEFGINTTTFDGEYVLTDRGKGIIKDLKKLVKECSVVWLATDDDREGESIAWHLKDELKLKKYHRVTFKEITKEAVTAAFDNPGTIDMGKVNSQQGRRLLDRVIGWIVSPALSKAAGEKLSAGRVQSVAVLLLVDLERRIRAFIKTNHFGVRAHFESFVADWDTTPFVSAENPYFMDRNAATALLAQKQFCVKSFERTNNNRNAPPPLNTSTLQQAASVALSYSPDKSMQVAQRLYELGLISYHRTDSLNLANVAIESIRNYLIADGKENDLPDTPNKWASADGAQEAHEAIRPSDVNNKEPAGLNSEEQALYLLIWNRAVACQMKPAVYNNAKAGLEVTNDLVGFTSRPRFEATSKILFYPGWLKIAAESENEDEEKLTDAGLPDLEIDSIIDATTTELLEKSTQPPKRLTEAGLVKALERESIGRPSTYASIVKNITAREYIKIEKRKIFATEKGELVVDKLAGKLTFMDLKYTKDMEKALDDVSLGKVDFKTLVKDALQLIKTEVSTLTNTAPPKVQHACGVCARPLRLVKGTFWTCTGYATGECKKTYSDKNGEPDFFPKPKPVIATSEFKCEVCEKALIRRTTPPKNGKPESFWYGCSGFPGCKKTYQEKDGKPAYPVSPAQAS